MTRSTWLRLGTTRSWHLAGQPCAPDAAIASGFYSTESGIDPAYGAVCRRCYVVARGGGKVAA